MTTLRVKHGFIALLALAGVIFGDRAASAQSGPVTCADMAGQWTGVHDFNGAEKYDLSIVVKPDCSYVWKSRAETNGKFQIEPSTVYYRNDSGSFGTVTITVADGRRTIKLNPRHGRYTATATKAG